MEEIKPSVGSINNNRNQSDNGEILEEMKNQKVKPDSVDEGMHWFDA